MGVGVIEYAIFAFMFVASGGYGVPVGVAPGVEDPYLHQVAPEDCLMYASWSGTTSLNSDNPTEELLSQKGIQTFLEKLKDACDEAAMDVEGFDPSRKAYRKLVAKLPELALTQPTCFYVDSIEWTEDGSGADISGAFVFHLGDRKDEFVPIVAAIEEVPDYDINPFFYGLAGILGTRSWGAAQQRAFEVQGDYLIFAFGTDEENASPKRVTINANEGEPQWLKNIKEELAVERRGSISMLDIERLKQFMDRPGSSELMRVLEDLGLDGVQRMSWVTGLDANGFVCRTTFDCDDDLDGLLKVFDLPALKPEDLRGVGNHDVIVASKVSADELYGIIEDLASNVGERGAFNEMIAEFEAFSGISLKEDLINDLDEHFYVYGDFELTNFGKFWVAGIGIRDDMSFSETLSNFNKRIEEVVEENDELEFQVDEIEGVKVHTVKDLRNAWAWYNSPSWVQVDSQLLIAFDKEALFKHVRAIKEGEAEFKDAPGVKRMFEFAEKEGLEGPIAAFNIDWKSALEMVKPYVGMVGDYELIPELEIRFSDIPEIDVLVNGVKPSVTGVYRTKNGFQMYQQQVQPGGSPVATFAFSGIASFLLLELEDDY